MAVRQLFRISVLLLLAQMLYRAVTRAQQCTGGPSAESILGWMLQGHIFNTMLAELPSACATACRQDDRCQSINWVISLHMCEFNNRTKEARPEDFIPNPDRFYFGREINRVPLGSIPELPAQTCKEIKSSEGEQAVSGKYWFDSIKPGKTILAECDMNTEDINECSAAVQLCDLNADCFNTDGSYYCSCLTGFTKDGELCKDIDECDSGSHSCLSDTATCTNTIGSYNCACKPGYEGDGKTSCVIPDIDECASGSHSCLSDTATCTNTDGSYNCACKPGYEGDGKTSCVIPDIDECASGSHSCLSDTATCTNTDGSYNCACKPGYEGDGKTSCVIPECQTYQFISGHGRKHTHGLHGSAECDATISGGWHRFQGDQGTKMPTSCVPINSCNTLAPGWLNGAHPTVADGQVTRQVCFNWESNCCYWSINIQVRNCGDFYVYYLSGTPANKCSLRFCGSD